MSQSPCIYVLNKNHPKYEECLGDLDWILSDEYAEVIEARLTSMRGTTTTMYLADRFEPNMLVGKVGEWIDVQKQIQNDVACFLDDRLPADMSMDSFTARVQPYHDNTQPYKRRNEQGDLDLVHELVEFLQSADESTVAAKDLYVVRSWW
jgi:hypothetical protein